MFKYLCVVAVLFVSTVAAAPAPVVSATCFASGEYTNGMTKICYYDCYCGKKAINLKNWQICPASMQFDC